MNNQTVFNNNTLWGRFTNLFFSDQNKIPRRKLFNTLWAIFFGFLISGILIAFSGHNPFSVFISLFREGATTFGNKFISVFVAYLIASLAVSLCFKSGLFNIGISGQMMLGGFTTLMIFTKMDINGASVFLAIIMAAIGGALIAILAGILKTYFGINEVVSTIMLNWIIFFIIKFLVQDISYLHDADSLAANLSIGFIMPNFYQPSNENASWYSNNWNWIILSFALVFVMLIWVILKKTSFGYKVKMIGLNKDAAEYSGTNKNRLIIIIMAISGALSGLAGFIWYIGEQGQIDISEQPLTAGFDAIAISLLAFNNPLGISATSFFYGMMNVGALGIPTEFAGLPKEINEIVIGIMVYVAAICVIFTKLNGWEWIKKLFILSPVKKYRDCKIEYWKFCIKHFFDWFKVKWQICLLRIQNQNKWSQIKKEHRHRIIQLENKFFEKYQNETKRFDVSIMNDDDQIKYFDSLAKIKKEIDFELAKNNYFKKNNILAKYQEEYKTQKNKHHLFKKLVLDSYRKYKQTLLCVKSLRHIEKQTNRLSHLNDLLESRIQKEENNDKKIEFKQQVQSNKKLINDKWFNIEEALIVSWFEINSIDLSEELINQNKVIKLKDSIVRLGKEYEMATLITTTEQSYQKEGGE